MWLLLLPVCLAIFSRSFTTASEPHYVITVPVNLPQGSEEKACVTFLDLKGAVDLKFELKKDDQVFLVGQYKIDDPDDHSECYPLKIPVIKESSSVWSLHVTAHGDHINVDESKKVVITKQDVCIIQTDKLMYKPGDTVRIRVISMQRNYHATDKVFPLVVLSDPNKQRIQQWLDVSTNHGFAELTFHLADELSLGQYSLNLPDFCKKTFEVDEYVPKRFEVKIIAPSNIAITDKSFHLEACGRYTYGKPVEGTIDISICPSGQFYPNIIFAPGWFEEDDFEISNDVDDDRENCINIKKVKTDSKGCLLRDINIDFFNFTRKLFEQRLKIRSSVTEDQTGHSESSSAKVILNTHKKIEFFTEMMLYQKGLPVHCKVKVTDEKNQPMPNTKTYYYVTQGYGSSPSEPHVTALTDENGIAHVTLNTSDWDLFMSVKAMLSFDENDDDRYSAAYLRVAPLYSQSESQLTITRPSQYVECDSEQTVTVGYDIHRKTLDSDTNHLHVIYLLRSATGIVLYKEHKIDIKDQSNNPIIHGSFPITFHVEAEMFPYVALVVFSVLPNGQTIANFSPFIVPFCTKEKVQLKFSEEQVHPGESVNLEVSAIAGSLCSIRSVDKGHLLHKRQGISPVSDLKREISEMVFSFIHSRMENIEDPESHQCPENELPENDWLSEIDVYSIFTLPSKLKIFTNSPIKKPKKCISKPVLSGRSGQKKKVHKALRTPEDFTRSYFPETWLFELIPIDSDGHSVLNRTTPHSVTNWVTSAFCLGKTGFATAKDVELTTFQPHFIDLIVPYSVVQGEKFTVQAVVFSYVKKCILIVVTLPDTEDLATVKNKEQARCVCEGHSHSFTWDVTAVKPKTLQIHVDSGSLEVDGECTENPLLLGSDHRKDSVEKTIIVKPKGHEEEKTQTFLLYPSESKEEIHVTVNLPERLVAGSERAHIIILGDFLASVAANFDRLINLPGGCGEQNLDKIFRLVVIMNYLKTIEELTPDKRATMIEELVKVYQKQLTFRKDDGSYSFFPGDSVNIWLTASVVRALSGAQEWIYIDEQHIQEAVNRLQTVQLSNGCFSVEGHYFNNKLEADNEVTLTAFIVISLLEHHRVYNGSIVEDALTCLRKSVDDDGSVHSQALLAYAFTLSGDHELRDQILKKLDEKAVKKNGLKHWDTGYGHSGEIVAASIILLAVLSDKTTPVTKRLEASADTIRWLVTHQNSNGGFYSTQDTAPALQALAKYSAAIKHMKGDSTVTIRSESGFEKIVHLDKSNSLLIQTVDLPHIPGEYTVSVTGKGLVYVQSHLHYNALPDPSERGHFSLNVSTEPSVCTHESQRTFDVHLDVSYSGKRQNTNMAVILIEPLSGHLPCKASIKKLNNNLQVKRTEVSAKKISIYLDKLTHTPENLVFSLEQETNVENLQPATITVYDYYDPDEHSTVEYNAPCSAVVAHCDVSAGERADCGHPGVTREECERKGCCFNSSVHGSKWCFVKGFKKIENH